jgi:hypothetical protein
VVIDEILENQSLLALFNARDGCAKTFLINAILTAVRRLEPGGCVALARLRLELLPTCQQWEEPFIQGRRAPLTQTEESTLQIRGQSSLANLMRIVEI